ncbi:MAG: GH3 auxin-responsive promoter family protein [Bacteroidales bacterium]
MQILNTPIRTYFAFRDERLEILRETQLDTQEKWYKYFIKHAPRTLFGKEHGITTGMIYEQFVEHLPLQNYNTLSPYINRVIRGEDDVLWDSKIEWVAKSSGTTSSKSKYVPVSNESLKLNNYLAARDSLTFYTSLFPETEMFAGKAITLGGSLQAMEPGSVVKCGDVSAILMDNMPFLGDFLKAPNREILMHSNWNEKLYLIAENTVDENITSLSGVPSWMLLVLKEVLKIADKDNLMEVWPNLEVFFHGGVAFGPYREEYKKIIRSDKVFYMNMYNASEGFFGFQDQKQTDDLLLLTDHGIFYEFVPIDEVGSHLTKAVQLHEVELNRNYAIVITTAAGLWRYEIGDTVMFTSKFPYRFKITGRTAHYINAFGEELIVDNADKAVYKACQQTDAVISDYTAAPVFLEKENNKACHEWIIEFLKEPSDIRKFTETLDNSLKSLNSDYEAKRTGSLILNEPKIHIAPKGTFLKWLSKRNKLGGQYKVPRLQNNREIIEEILQIMAD